MQKVVIDVILHHDVIFIGEFVIKKGIGYHNYNYAVLKAPGTMVVS